jgi:LysM repeat protein
MPFRNVQIDIDNAVFQTALNRATTEGKAIGQVIADFLQQYAGGAAAGAPTSYTVQRGDTLGKIAMKVYGDAYKYPLIQQANNLQDASQIWVGQVLMIPAIIAPTIAPMPVTSPPTPTVPVVEATPPTATPAVIVAAPPTPVVSTAPARPAIQWAGSPNFNNRRSPTDITAVVIHSTANSSLERVIEWFNNPNSQVSAHYTIGKDGRIAQHVPDKDRAWHAGQSTWKGRNGCNDYTIGIELVNLNDGRDPYPEIQHQANVALCAYLCYTYKINTDDIMGHLDIALPPGRKSDPRGYDLNRLRREVAAVLGNSS